jgi:hypothetical protein
MTRRHRPGFQRFVSADDDAGPRAAAASAGMSIARVALLVSGLLALALPAAAGASFSGPNGEVA